MGTYYDAVLDDNMQPLANGVPAQIVTWLKLNPQVHNDVQICVGQTVRLVTVDEYFAMHA